MFVPPSCFLFRWRNPHVVDVPFGAKSISNGNARIVGRNVGEDFNASIGEHRSVMGSHEGDIVDDHVKTDYGIAAISGSRRVHPNAFPGE